MTFDWTPIIGVSVAIIALAQVATMIGVAVAVRRLQSGVQQIEQRVETAVEEFRPQLTALVDEARTASVQAQHLVADVRRQLDAAEEAARSVRERVYRVVDGVQSVSSNFPVPVKVSGSAAMAVWAGLKLAKGVFTQLKDRKTQVVSSR